MVVLGPTINPQKKHETSDGSFMLKIYLLYYENIRIDRVNRYGKVIRFLLIKIKLSGFSSCLWSSNFHLEAWNYRGLERTHFNGH